MREGRSRSLQWQKDKLREGLCSICGKRALNYYRQRCDKCQEKQREERRRKNGAKPWKPGGMGRPIRGYEIDWKKVNWRKSNREIADKLGVSISAVYQRRKRLKK